MHTLAAEVNAMAQLSWQALNLMQIFDVLRSARTCHLAVEEDGQPWCVMMHFQFEIQGADVIIHLTMPDHGRKLDAMAGNDQVCIAIESPSCAWTDTVILTGRATVGVYVPGKAIHLRVRAKEISGRRYFLPEDV